MGAAGATADARTRRRPCPSVAARKLPGRRATRQPSATAARSVPAARRRTAVVPTPTRPYARRRSDAALPPFPEGGSLQARGPDGRVWHYFPLACETEGQVSLRRLFSNKQMLERTAWREPPLAQAPAAGCGAFRGITCDPRDRCPVRKRPAARVLSAQNRPMPPSCTNHSAMARSRRRLRVPRWAMRLPSPCDSARAVSSAVAGTMIASEPRRVFTGNVSAQQFARVPGRAVIPGSINAHGLPPIYIYTPATMPIEDHASAR